MTFPNSETRRGRVQDDGNTSPALTSGSKDIGVLEDEEPVRIRRLTPRECFRLQGWTDDYFDKAQLVNSDNQLYKQAGNVVTVAVIKAIGEQLRYKGD